MRDRRRGGDESERWLTTYADVVTLLLAFFVMLFSMSTIEPAAFGQMVSGLEEPFNNPGRVDSVAEPDETEIETEPAQATRETATTITTPTKDYLVPPLVVDRDQLGKVEQDLDEALALAGFADAAEFRITERGLVVSIATDNLQFASGSAELGPEGREMIAAMAPALAAIANPIQIEGHTDDVPFEGTGYDNWDLSSDRALAVLRALSESPDIDPVRLGATGYSSYRPLTTNDDEAGRSTNRRVELVVSLERQDRD